MGGRFVISANDTLAPLAEMDTSRPFTSRSVPTPIQQGRGSLFIDASKREHNHWFRGCLAQKLKPCGKASALIRSRRRGAVPAAIAGVTAKRTPASAAECVGYIYPKK